MKWLKVTLVVFGAVIITALGIDAADTLNGSDGTLLSQVVNSGAGGCPKGMTPADSVPSVSCVDIYEASASEKCPVSQPEQLTASIRNLEFGACQVESRPQTLPWRFITRDQAMQMCARAGKRLPTSEEWYALSLGMSSVEESCNISSRKVSEAGSYESCASPAGVYDLIGNVWEWVSDDIIDGKYGNTELPDSGFVAQVDSGGMATVSSEEPQELFGNDYFWSRKDGAYGVIRGGYYDSESDGGLYAVHADTLPTTASVGIGFRCVK